MASSGLSDKTCLERYNTWKQCGENYVQAAKILGISREVVRDGVMVATMRGLVGKKPDFEAPQLPTELPTLTELLEKRRKTFARRDAAEKARKLIRVKVNVDGPIGLAHFGDPHVDDPGCNFPQLEKDITTVDKTKGMFGCNVGDLQNNWVGRLAHLWSKQDTNAAEAWMLVEWLVKSIPWLYLVGGNHDAWSGAGDPLQWITRDQAGVYDNWGVRLCLVFPNGKEVRVNARHDFAGHSMWNPNHGPVKAIKAGWRDHILTCGHKHETGFGPPLKDPASGLISWPLRCAGYKIHDDYGKTLGLPDQNISPTITTVIDPRYADDDPRLITPFLGVQEAAEFLKFKRKKHG